MIPASLASFRVVNAVQGGKFVLADLDIKSADSEFAGCSLVFNGSAGINIIYPAKKGIVCLSPRFVDMAIYRYRHEMGNSPSWSGIPNEVRLATDWARPVTLPGGRVMAAAMYGRRTHSKPVSAEDILARHKAGEKHTSIATDYGTSRQRIHQIVKAAGGGLRHHRAYVEKDQRSDAIKRFALAGATAEDAAKAEGITVPHIQVLARSLGVKLPTAEAMARRRKAEDAYVLVQAGESHFTAAKKAGVAVETVRRHCLNKIASAEGQP